MGQYCSCK